MIVIQTEFVDLQVRRVDLVYLANVPKVQLDDFGLEAGATGPTANFRARHGRAHRRLTD